ncbi:16S rRNA (cytosine(967)-C(5))-methyltransferase RsmB [Desulfobacter curvatus]|uniref:16S rRNA (cytosine(967)-C(5))-methyltransferase RsmB n=1 Tax=Desulfobacter curvatus TaxID=2290 RepID=UPI000363D5DB|nr:16S rRNA (cytosine(967)-C(5))-methyltransferase RsmB [Desulfobacter curvatus]
MNKDADPRYIAFTLIEAGQKPTLPLDRAIENAAQQLEHLSQKDKGLCHAIVFGVFRHRGRIDQLICHCSKLAFDRIDAKVKTILRIGVFQIVFLDRVPDFAAINTSIELAKPICGKKASGFINAVLRNISRSHKDIALPCSHKNLAGHLTAAFSIPSWLGKRWAARYGKEKTLALAGALMDLPPLTLRINPRKISREQLIEKFEREGINNQATRFSPLGLQIRTSGVAIPDLPGFNEGMFQIQDEAAQLAVQLLGPKPGETILDACAGLGTKTCHMALEMENKGQITANDTGESKADRLDNEAGRLNINIIRTTHVDMARAGFNDFSSYFDRVLVDAPCTGLGVLARNPDSRWKRKANDIMRMAALQKKILNGSANLVAPGGVLVYTVCSCEPEETTQVVERFLEKRKDFTPDPSGFERHLPFFCESGIKTYSKTTFPDHLDMDGFFMARMRRNKNRR